MTAVRELMTRDPACVETDQTLQEAAEIMSRLGVGALPICGPDRKIKGVLTDRDLVVRALAEGKSLSTTAGNSTRERRSPWVPTIRPRSCSPR